MTTGETGIKVVILGMAAGLSRGISMYRQGESCTQCDAGHQRQNRQTHEAMPETLTVYLSQMTSVGCGVGQARYEVPRVTPRTACPISLMVGYVPVVVVVVVVLSTQ